MAKETAIPDFHAFVNLDEIGIFILKI